jgi:hypothetical protein
MQWVTRYRGQNSREVKGLRIGIRPELAFHLCHLLALGPWKCHLSFMFLSLLMYKIRVVNLSFWYISP